MRFTFSHRIIGVLLIMAALSLCVGYFAFVTINHLQRNTRAILKENVMSFIAADELEVALLNQKGLVANYFLDGNRTWLTILENAKNDFNMWFKRANDVAFTSKEKIILEEVRSVYKAYDTQRDNAITSYQKGNVADAQRILLTDMSNYIDSLYRKCDDLVSVNEALIAKTEAASQRDVLTMKGFILITILIALCLGVFSGFFIARKVNEELVHSAKMASLGQLSANIAHEIRNPLTSIKMRLYSLNEELKSNVSSREDVNVITEEMNRMEKTINNFLDFARTPKLNLQKSSVDKILEGTINLISSKAESQNVRIEKVFNAQGVELDMDKEQIRQVFLNIMLNAIEAMPNGGVLAIDTRRSVEREHKNLFEITIKDTGVGISGDDRKRLFDPFFTTKADGTGLGLFISSRIIKLHKGRIDLASQADKGTTVTIKLPV